MKTAIRLAVVAAVAALLFYSNPKPDEFETYVQQRVEERLQEDSSSRNRLGRLLTEMGSSVVGSLAARASDRQNFLLFSLYTVDVGGDGDPDESWKFLGLLGFFFELSAPDSD